MCLFTTVVVQIVGHPTSMVVNINSTVTLSCNATGSGPIRYQWRRVNGEISSDRAEGVNTSTLTISSVQQEDEDEYYCVASNVGIDELHYSDISHKAMVTIYGKTIKYDCIMCSMNITRIFLLLHDRAIVCLSEY